MKRILFPIILISLVFIHCKNEPSEIIAPSYPLFDPSHSEPDAIRVAETLIEASGGLDQWDSINVIKYSFLGRRWHVWDKKNNLVRIENTSNDTKTILDLNTQKARVYKDGKEWTEPDTLKKYSESAYKQHINDSYWLMMPFKVKDGGVRLKYVKEDTTQTGIQCEVIELRFDSVGITPQNKYHLWVGKNSGLLAQWAYFPKADMDTATIITPWDGYVKYGGVFLSSDRGNNRQLSGIKVYNSVPKSVFSSFDPVDFEHL